MAEQRTILTQDRGILKLKKVTHGYLVRSLHVQEQVVEVIRRFDLLARIDPFSRCTQCNGLIMSVDKADVQADLPPKTREYYHEFFRCQACGKVYWKGTHFSRLEAEVRQLVSRGAEPQGSPCDDHHVV